MPTRDPAPAITPNDVYAVEVTGGALATPLRFELPAEELARLLDSDAVPADLAASLPAPLAGPSVTAPPAPAEPAGLDEALWGTPPSRAAVARADATVTRLDAEARRGLIRHSVTRADAAARLGISPQAVSKLIERKRLVALKEGREWRIPAWQLSDDAAHGILPGLTDAYVAYAGGVVSFSLWATTPHVDLDGGTPAAALAAGRTETVTALARAAGRP